MTVKLLLAAAAAVIFLSAANAEAEKEDEESPCPSGQVQVTFADGNSVSTACIDAGAEMDETVPAGTEGEQDPGNYD